MNGKTDEEIKTERNNAITIIKTMVKEDFEIIDSFFEGAPHDAKPLWFLSKSFELLSTADLACFVGNPEKYRGCGMEYMACEKYGIPTIVIDNNATA